MTDSTELQNIRQDIDEIDSKIQRLINQRATYAVRVAQIKTEIEDSSEFYRPEREAQVLKRVYERNEGPLSSEEMARLFREVMSACLALEQPMNIAYLGPEGTFTQAAALKHFGHSVNTSPSSTINHVFREVESGVAHYGVVPIENSTEGVINHTLDLFINSPLKICGEVHLRIHHNLLTGMSGEQDLSKIKTIYAHQQSLAQCRGWLDANLPQAERVAVGSNAEAAKLVSEMTGDATSAPRCAAIAGETAAELYNLRVAVPNIEDEPDNTTRFLIIGTQTISASGQDKTTVMLSVKNEPGALFKLLTPISEKGISLTRIESRPSRKGNWEYVFFLDLEGHANDAKVQDALAQVESQSSLFKVLGAYPKAVL